MKCVFHGDASCLRILVRELTHLSSVALLPAESLSEAMYAAASFAAVAFCAWAKNASLESVCAYAAGSVAAVSDAPCRPRANSRVSVIVLPFIVSPNLWFLLLQQCLS